MKNSSLIAMVVLPVTVLLLFGCGSSEDASQKQQPASTSSAPASSTESAKKADTVSVNVQNTPKQSYEPKASSLSAPSGKFSVQVGAYKMSENAERVASLARERFKKNVYTLVDQATNLFKVLVGDFAVKDDARSFRDEMASQYPGDYKDAWVAETPQQ